MFAMAQSRPRLAYFGLRSLAIAVAAIPVSWSAIAAERHPDQAKASAKITGTVRNQAGEPLEGVQIQIRSLEGSVHNKIPKDIRTDSQGEYAIAVQFSGTAILNEIAADFKGFVRAEQQPEAELKEGQTVAIDFKMSPGEVLKGAIDLPLEGFPVGTPNPNIHTFVVEGPGFTQRHRTATGGAFEVYVPRGVYTIRVPFYSRVDPPEWKGLKSGSQDLLLKLKPFVYAPETVGNRFDLFCETIDHSYSYFPQKKDVDWTAVQERYRPKAIKATSRKEFVAVLSEMLAVLKDLHVWIETPDGLVGTFSSSYEPNWNRAATLALLEDRTDCGFAVVGRTKRDGYGCFLMVHQSRADESSVRQALKAMDKLYDAPAFIVDLRQANGGSEPLAEAIARWFCATETVYARSKYRNGPAHDQFTEAFRRVLKASARPFAKPVVCLIGPGAVSSGEGFVQMMKCLPNVTTVGLPTRGASGNPQPVPLAGMDLNVWFSRWVDLMPDGAVFEGKGIEPDITVREPRQSYQRRDPTLEKGLELLAKKVAKRAAGREHEQ